MSAERPTLRVREWSTTYPERFGAGAVLYGLDLTAADRELLATLEGSSSLRVTELRQGLQVSVGPHVGTVSLSGLRIVIVPKMQVKTLMRMVGYVFDLSDLWIGETSTPLPAADGGFVDLLGLSLLRSVERLVRGGLLPEYRNRVEDLASPRGRIDMRHAATHPRRATLRCTFDDLTADCLLNQVIAAGLRLASKVMDSPGLRLDLARAADRFFGDLRRIDLDARTLQAAGEGLDRRSSHYRTAVSLTALIFQGSRLGKHAEPGEMPLASFTLNMNTLFERFLTRHLREAAPADVEVSGQEVRSGIFSYLENPHGWQRPRIRPDLVFRRRGKEIAVGDAKYKNRHDHPPTASELYQLTIYGLSYRMPEPREVLLLYPSRPGKESGGGTLLFAPPAGIDNVSIRLVGVPVDRMLEDAGSRWWPQLSHQLAHLQTSAGSTPPPHGSPPVPATGISATT